MSRVTSGTSATNRSRMSFRLNPAAPTPRKIRRTLYEEGFPFEAREPSRVLDLVEQRRRHDSTLGVIRRFCQGGEVDTTLPVCWT